MTKNQGKGDFSFDNEGCFVLIGCIQLVENVSFQVLFFLTESERFQPPVKIRKCVLHLH